MLRSSRSPFLSLALAVAIAAACAPPPEEPQGCENGAQCPSSARCVARACVTNSAPSPSIALPSGALETARLLTFDGSASSDPDAGDGIASRAWTFRALGAPCAPPAVASTEPTATVRFGCAGRFAVELAVADRLGASAVASREFEVTPYSGPPLLALSSDVAVGHRCASGLCTTSAAVELSAEPTAAAPAGLSLVWTVEPPPGRALGAHRRVSFGPGPDVASPSVTVETDGQAISGDWIFHVEARDGDWVVASGAIRVSIGNSPPVLTKTLTVANHGFDGRQLVAEGVVPFTVSDPDGDDLLPPVVEWRHAGDGPGARFSGAVLDSPRRVTYAVGVPYASPPDAAYLIGGLGLERTIRFSVSDVNDGTVSEEWPIAVGNRPPELVAEPAGGLSVDHAFDPAASAYVAAVPLSSWSDPDGDPLFPATGTSTGDPVCASLELAGGLATVRCSVPFQGTPAVQALAGAHVVTQHVQDPWEAASRESAVGFTILNRPPVLVTAPVTIPTTCTTGDCCRTERVDGGMPDCVAFQRTWEPASTMVAGRWIDDDGDPLEITVTGSPRAVCTPGTCNLPITSASVRMCIEPHALAIDATASTSAHDGLASASGAIPLLLSCR